MDLSSAFSVLFTTLERYYQHLKAIISAFGNVQYHMFTTWRNIISTAEGAHHTGGEMDDKPPNGIVHGFSVALIIFLYGTDDIPFTVFVYYKEFRRRHYLTLMTECPMAGLDTDRMQLTGQV